MICDSAAAEISLAAYQRAQWEISDLIFFN